ncbi:Fe-S protein assembly co-chaperone HscB [Pontibacter cellulosilyticus]|uniref:Fe-S protein assembly co-chaperone HscB n=1 Tax=Pontibacter cellulosilyticus TaxID=1720253 RepID=A0A923N4W0_9BACT|nr:Fe-S protein assembly co-chaperone HscB [Pontibacter cellulosilyticus]MBC5992593.1 Fe-S protein assembly co-chaperone HscB [Pontibacter cellulosilyticus]
MINYFEFYNIPESFILDEKALKAKYYQLSREYHPDFYANEPQQKQDEILQLSTQNTNAYRTLSDPDLRIQYILKEHGVLEEGKNELPSDFLMEMMELNEELMELEFDFDAAKLHEIGEKSSGLMATMDNDILPVLQRYPELHGVTKEEALQEIKTYYLKKKYLLRIQETLSKFAARS